MSKSLVTRLSALESLREGQEPPRPAIVAIKSIAGTISANIPGQTGPEIFADASELEARADELGLRCICVTVVDGRKGAAVAQA